MTKDPGTSVPTPEQNEMALAIVKAHYPEMSASYRGRRYLIALAAIIETQEACAKLAEEHAITFLSPDYATNQPFSSMGERFACNGIATAIRTGNHYGKASHDQ